MSRSRETIPLEEPTTLHRWAAPLCFLAGLLLLVGAGLSVWSSEDGALVVDPPSRSVSGTPPNQDVPLRFTIRNTTSRAIRIVGADDRCDLKTGCAQTKGLPLAIPAGESRPLDILFKARVSPYTYRMTLYTDDPKRAEILVLISG